MRHVYREEKGGLVPQGEDIVRSELAELAQRQLFPLYIYRPWFRYSYNTTTNNQTNVIRISYMYIGKEDKIVSMILLTPHEGDFLYKRPDSTTYVRQIRKKKEDTFYIPTTQLELNL